MVRQDEDDDDVGVDGKDEQQGRRRPPVCGLIVGNYCHDVLFRGGHPVGGTLGGAASFISNVLDAISPSSSFSPFNYVSKVGRDFAYAVSYAPLIAPTAPTTLFHALFPGQNPAFGNDAGGDGGVGGGYPADRVLKRVRACDPITPTDLPNTCAAGLEFDFGLSVGVAGEILPETLSRMIALCRIVFVDVQSLIRTFDPVDGTVQLVQLEQSGFYHLLPRIRFLKASAEEAPFVDVGRARKSCCVIVTEGKDGCSLYWKDGVMKVPAFPAVQIDPTGAGDSFLGGFVAGLIWGLPVSDAALLGNFFGALTVGQIGIPKFDQCMLQYVKQQLELRARKCVGSYIEDLSASIQDTEVHKEFHENLLEAAKMVTIKNPTVLV